MGELQALKTAILADGKVDANEVAQLRHELLADGKIDHDEAKVLFEINDKVSGNASNDPSWGALFVEALTSYVLGDEKSPGVIDDEEAAFLASRIQGDGGVDESEKALLANLKAKASGPIPSVLQALIDKHC